MSSNKSGPPLRVEPRSSARLAMALLLLHGSAVMAVVQLTLAPWLVMALAGSIVMSLYFTFSTFVLHRGRLAVASLFWDADGEWTVVTAEGRSATGHLLEPSYVHARLLVLNFLLDGGARRTVVLLPDALDSNTFRRLLVRLRTERP